MKSKKDIRDRMRELGKKRQQQIQRDLKKKYGKDWRSHYSALQAKKGSKGGKKRWI